MLICWVPLWTAYCFYNLIILIFAKTWFCIVIIATCLIMVTRSTLICLSCIVVSIVSIGAPENYFLTFISFKSKRAILTWRLPRNILLFNWMTFTTSFVLLISLRIIMTYSLCHNYLYIFNLFTAEYHVITILSFLLDYLYIARFL